jgi:hypothetical protein
LTLEVGDEGIAVACAARIADRAGSIVEKVGLAG